MAGPGRARVTTDPHAATAILLDGGLDGAVVAESLRRAHVCGAYAVGAVGDTTALPTREELDAGGEPGQVSR